MVNTIDVHRSNFLNRERFETIRRGGFRKVMSNPPTITSGSASTLPTLVPSSSGSASYPVTGFVNGNFTINKTRNLQGLNQYVYGGSAQNVLSPAAYYSNQFGVSAFITDSVFEFGVRASGTDRLLVVKIDDEYVSLTPTAPGTGGALVYYKYDFSSVGGNKERRVDIIGTNISFVGFFLTATGAIRPAPNRGPRMVILGNSFIQSQGNASGSTMGVVQTISDSLGWDDVIGSGVGGADYLSNNSGTSPTFRQRVVGDFLNANPQVGMIFGMGNDVLAGFTPSQVDAEAALLYAQIREAKPDMPMFVVPSCRGGVNRADFPAYIAMRNVLRARANEFGFHFIDTLERPLRGTPQSGLTSGAQSSGASTLTTNFVMQPGSVLDINGVERVHVRSFVNVSTGVYRATIDGVLRNSHASGVQVTQVGPCYITGTGNTGTPSGFGNADVFVGPDGLHQTDLGYTALGTLIANDMMSTFASYA